LQKNTQSQENTTERLRVGVMAADADVDEGRMIGIDWKKKLFAIKN